MRHPIRLIGCGISALLFHVGVAHAQVHVAPDGPADRDQNMVFDDDLLNANLVTPFGDPVFSGHLRLIHVRLIRPRTSFVPELYKSVEQI